MYYIFTLTLLCGLAAYFLISPNYERVRVRTIGDIRNSNSVANIEKGALCPIVDLTKVIKAGEESNVRIYLNDLFIFFHSKDKIMVRTYHGLKVMEAKEYLDVEVY